ncbi:hemolysin family protein [Pseudostreptobacillus hongkongensis]|uniref:hemolysin family protein n=1 Tax=Pseudostreptobacillus hongkongensis TaxID=1162717 RepID=UPI00082BB886|nr:hemolysin family protein [Pseudostreptobacillus hongkongensis]
MGTSSSILPQIILIIVLIFVNAFFSASEMAIVSVNKNRLKILIEEGNEKAKKLDKLMEDPSKLLSTIQIGITLAGFLASASAAVAISDPFKQLLMMMNVPYYSQLSLLIVTMLLSYLSLVFGELIPKQIALLNSEKIALANINIIMFVYRVFIPFIKILTFSTNIVLAIFNIKEKSDLETVSKEEIKLMVNDSEIKDSEREMIEKIMDFDDKVAREIMIPRTSMFALDVNSDIKDIFESENIIRYSRIPVYFEDLDNIVGILHTKSLLKRAYEIGFDDIDIKSLLQEAYFVPETKKIQSLFIEMKNLKKHIAILIDEYGGVSGIVTLEDLLEEIVGNINDEYDMENDDIQKLSKNKYLVNAAISINDLNDALNIEMVSNHYDSLNGIIIEKLGYIPIDNNKIKDLIIGNLKIKVVKVKNKRIEKVILEIMEEEKNEI